MKCGSSNIFHIKTDRKNEDVECCTEYKQSELNKNCTEIYITGSLHKRKIQQIYISL